MTTFKHPSLTHPSRDIRLIHLHGKSSDIRRGSVADEQAISCGISVVPLEKAPAYVALSYTWGDPNDTLPIFLDGYVLQITRNLHSALVHLRLNSSSRILWVDAICIDQQNNAEKSEQIQLMRDIYHRAMHVTVWLGPSDDSSDGVVAYLNNLGEEAMDCHITGLLDPIAQKWAELFVKPGDYRDKGMSSDGGNIVFNVNKSDGSGDTLAVPLRWICDLYYKLSDRHDASMTFPLDGMDAFFKRPWWSRIWILQEFAAAKAVGFLCGKSKLTRGKCVAALKAFITFRYVVLGAVHTSDQSLTKYEEAVGLANFDPRPNNILGIRNVLERHPLNLLALLRSTCVEENGLKGLSRTHSMQSTDPADRIYGLLGLASDRDALGIVPDYRHGCQKIYTDTTRALLREGHVSVLSLCQLPKNLSGLPSWVPDWSAGLKMHLQGVTRSYEPLLQPSFFASGESRPHIEFTFTHEGDEILGLVGVIVDTVCATGTTYTEIANGGGNMVDWSQRWIKVLFDLSMLSVKTAWSHRDDNDYRLSVFLTSTAGAATTESEGFIRATGEGVKAAVMLGFLGIDEEVLRADGILGMLERNGMPPRVTRESFAEVGGYRYIGTMGARARGRKPFVTSQGHLGLGPLELEQGDSVAVFLGFQVPFIIRDLKDGTYQLIGDTYLDNFMDGEALEGNPVFELINLS